MKKTEKIEMTELEGKKIPKEKREYILKEIDKRLAKGESVTVITDTMFFGVGSVMDLAGNIYAGVMETMENAPYSKFVFERLGEAIQKGARGESIEDPEENNRTEKLLSALKDFRDKIEKL